MYTGFPSHSPDSDDEQSSLSEKGGEILTKSAAIEPFVEIAIL